ncbi:MAG TPA: hypothetical protein VGI40_16750 [Pirellulaceae bacterium]
MPMARRISLFVTVIVALCGRTALLAQESRAGGQLAEAQPAYWPVQDGYNASEQDVQDFDVEQASMLWQQPAGQPAAPSLSAPPARSTRTSRQSNVGLASVPNMFGDCGMTTAAVTIDSGRALNGGFMLPMVGGSRTGKMAENDIAMPVDRVFFGYNHYADIFQMQTQPVFGGPGQFRQEPIDRYTVGAEKTFFNQMTSIEVRMPFTGSFDASLPGLGVSNGNFGNMALIFKGLLYRGQNLGIGAGVAVDTPTGSDFVSRLGTVNMRFVNQAVHLLPYVGFLYSPGDSQWGWGDNVFMTGFLQYDAAANGNNIRFETPNGTPITSLGKFNEQDILFVDLSLGYWIYRNPMARWSGLALISEMHYTTSMQNTDIVSATAPGVGATVTNPSNRFDVMNGTFGFQVLMFDMSSLRVAGVFPMGSRMDQRFFDDEIQVQFNRRF